MSRWTRKRSGPPFVMIEKATLQSREFNELSHNAQLIYIKIKANYRGFNNGLIPFTYRGDGKGFSSATIARCLEELQSTGWIEKTEFGGLHRTRSLYKLTGKYDYIRLPGRSRRPRNSHEFNNSQLQILKPNASKNEATQGTNELMRDGYASDYEAREERKKSA